MLTSSPGVTSVQLNRMLLNSIDHLLLLLMILIYAILNGVLEFRVKDLDISAHLKSSTFSLRLLLSLIIALSIGRAIIVNEDHISFSFRL